MSDAHHHPLCDLGPDIVPDVPLTDLTVIPRDSKGAPCFATYFRAVYCSIPRAYLDRLVQDSPPYPPREIEHINRLSTVLGHLADELADVLVGLYGDPEDVMQAFMRELPASIAAAQLAREQA